MIGKITVKERGATPRGMAKQFRQHSKQSWQSSGDVWHQRIRPKKFTRAAFYEYRYTPRSPRYLARKKRQFGETRPLVKTGETMQLTRMRDVRSTARGTRIVLHAPKLNLRSPTSAVNMRLEMMAVSKRDERIIAAAYDREYDHQIDSDTTTTTRNL